MGFQLGPGFLRRPPSGWVRGRAFPVEHALSDQPSEPGSSGSEIDTSYRLDATWEVQVEGREPYRFTECRNAPVWCVKSSPQGKRWYKLRMRGSHGLMKALGVPCCVDPNDGEQLWIDWDAAYDEHAAAWDQRDRVDRAVAARKGPLERFSSASITRNLAGKIRPEEEHLVDEAIAAEQAREAHQRDVAKEKMAEMGFGPVGQEERAEHDRRAAEMQRIHDSGRPATATVVSNEDSGRKLMNVPVIVITLDVDDGGTVRRIAYEHVWGPRHAKRYKPGKRIDVRIDQADPDAITLA